MSALLTVTMRAPTLAAAEVYAQELGATFFGGRDVKVTMVEAEADPETVRDRGAEFRCVFEIEAR